MTSTLLIRKLLQQVQFALLTSCQFSSKLIFNELKTERVLEHGALHPTQAVKDKISKNLVLKWKNKGLNFVKIIKYSLFAISSST